MGKKRIQTEPRRITGEGCLKYLFFGSFFIGILLANLSGSKRLLDYGIFNVYFLKQFEYSSISYTDLFLYILETRAPVFLFLAVLGVTELWYLAHVLFVMWNGGALGFLFVSGISNLGVKGILLVVLSLVPQYLSYVMLYLILFFAQQRLHAKGGRALADRRHGRWAGYLISCALAAVLLILGILSETYLNPGIMKGILKIF